MAEHIIEMPDGHGMGTTHIRELIVRCRDCEHAFDEGSGYLYCGRRPGHCFETHADGFCYWGKRRDD